MQLTESISNLMSGAIFSEDGVYRYSLWRFWNYQVAKDGNAKAVMFIMGNPSTAGKYNDDPTIIKCAKFAQHWGYDGMYIGNLYAVVSTHWITKQDKSSNDPIVWTKPLIGDDCDYWLDIMKNSSQLYVAAWGFIGNANPARVNEVVSFFPTLHHLGLSKNGQPKHPLYLPSNSQPIEWETKA